MPALPNDDARHDVAQAQPIDTAPPALPATGRLAALEAVIERGLRTFIEVGEALLEIRDDRLYREQGFGTFEDYCRKRWDWGRNYVNKQIAAAEVVRNLGTNVPKPQNEAQARELTRLSPDEQREVAATIDFSNTSAAEIRGKVAELTANGVAVEPVNRRGRVEVPSDADRAADIPAAATASESGTLRSFALNLRAGLDERSKAFKKFMHEADWSFCGGGDDEFDERLYEALNWVSGEVDKVLGKAKRRKYLLFP
jgi:hypothetical protein